MLGVVFYMKGKENADEGNQSEYISKNHAEPVDSTEDQVIVQKPDDPILSFRHLKETHHRKNRQKQHITGLEPSPKKGNEESTHDKNGLRGEYLSHL